MPSQVLWVIDSELSGRKFERLCIDLLYRNGYRDIVPIEPQDGGRDAEEYPRRGRARAGEAAFFQFSLEEDWRSKLRRDVRKLAHHRTKFSTLVFVTSQKARGVDVDQFTEKLRQEYGWELVVYSREWLRLQLEEAHPDLSNRHLGVEIPSERRHLFSDISFDHHSDERLSAALRALDSGAYERATAELKDFLSDQPESPSGWQALAWSQYCSSHYDEALASINRALKLDENQQGLSIRASILAEKGIKEGDRTSLLEARRIFKDMIEARQVSNWHVHYNLGNVSDALQEYQEAISCYKEALKIKADEPSIWKNLASAYHHADDHDAEMKCFDKALEIDPLKPEALVSKGVSLLEEFDKPEDAIALMERVIRFSPDWAVHWPHIWYWLGKAYRKSGLFEKALGCVEDGLSHQPGQLALKDLMSHILKDMLNQGLDITAKARRFWGERIAEEPFAYRARSNLALVEMRVGNGAAAWRLLEEGFPLFQIHPALPLRSSGFGFDDCLLALEYLPQYARFREHYPVSGYWDIKELFEKSGQSPSTTNVTGAMSVFLAIPFGLGMKYLEENSAALKKRTLTKSFDRLRSDIEHAMIESSREFADLLAPHKGCKEALVDCVSEIISHLGQIALLEFAWQRGWICSQFPISPQTLNSACEGYDESRIFANVVSGSFVRLDEVALFLPKQKR